MANNTFYAPNDYRNYLEHFGVKGMKWGVRRFQNKDGSLTSAGAEVAAIVLGGIGMIAANAYSKARR